MRTNCHLSKVATYKEWTTQLCVSMKPTKETWPVIRALRRRKSISKEWKNRPMVLVLSTQVVERVDLHPVSHLESMSLSLRWRIQRLDVASVRCLNSKWKRSAHLMVLEVLAIIFVKRDLQLDKGLKFTVWCRIRTVWVPKRFLPWTWTREQSP